MSSRRRSRSREHRSGADSKSSSKLRMDSKAPTPRITDPSLPAGRRREIDTLMKKARASPNSNAYWDKKLLEVEAKDPNRWRHSGYKSMYLDGSSSPSPSHHRSRSRSPIVRRSPRSPIGGGSRRSPRSPPSRRSPVGRRSPRMPPLRRTPPGGSRSPRSPLPSSRRSPLQYRSPIVRRSPPPSNTRSSSKIVRPRSPRSPPPHKGRRSPSGSSVSSCSDDSCSVCSPKNRRTARSRSRSFSGARSKPKGTTSKHTSSSSTSVKPKSRPRPPSPSPVMRRVGKPTTPPPMRRPARGAPPSSSSDKPTDPRRQPPPPRPRNTAGELINGPGLTVPMPKKLPRKEKEPILLKRIKKERSNKRPGSPDSSGSEASSTSSISPIVATTCMTLSERFGKMAQWSIDRERRDIENMRITKNSSGGDLKVMIEEDRFLYGSPPRRYSHSPVPPGHYPDELLPAGPSGLASWDDVRVRYQYYKDLGYLRDLSLEDYVKWEEWWYKYQDWLANERHYEHWMSTQRRRKKRIPATQRLN